MSSARRTRTKIACDERWRIIEQQHLEVTYAVDDPGNVRKTLVRASSVSAASPTPYTEECASRGNLVLHQCSSHRRQGRFLS